MGDDAAVPTPRPPRVAVALAGDPTDPSAWSGTPAGLCSGLVTAGAELVPVDVRFPAEARLMRLPGLEWTAEATNPLIAAANGAWGSRLLRRDAPLDAVVAIGSGYLLRTDLPLATYDDLTVAQGERQPWSDVSKLGRRAAARWQRRQRQIYRRARACCVGSAWAGESVREDYGIDPGKIHVVGHGRNFGPQRSERDWGTPRFLFVGVEWERKNGPAVLAAFSELRGRHPGATLDVVGGHPPLDAAGVRGHGRLSLSSTADRERLEGLFRRATCLVLPSAFEAFGIAYLDAGAAGVPSIGTTEGGARDAIGDGGMLVAPDDPDALAAAMERLADPAAARELGERAFAHSALFTWQAVAERVLGALEIPGFDPAPPGGG